MTKRQGLGTRYSWAHNPPSPWRPQTLLICKMGTIIGAPSRDSSQPPSEILHRKLAAQRPACHCVRHLQGYKNVWFGFQMPLLPFPHHRLARAEPSWTHLREGLCFNHRSGWSVDEPHHVLTIHRERDGAYVFWKHPFIGFRGTDTSWQIFILEMSLLKRAKKCSRREDYILVLRHCSGKGTETAPNRSASIPFYI